MSRNFSLIIGSARNGVQEARKRKHEKHVKKKSVKAVMDDWQDAIWTKYGKDVCLMSWSVKEKRLARILIDSFDCDTVEKMVNRFVEMWDEPGLPTFSYLWTKRESVLAIIRGQALARRGCVDVDEYDEERDGKQSKIGWD